MTLHMDLRTLIEMLHEAFKESIWAENWTKFDSVKTTEHVVSD